MDSGIKQVRIGEFEHQRLKRIAKILEIDLKDLNNKALKSFLEKRDLDRKNAGYAYLISPNKGKVRSYCFDKALLLKVKRLATTDGVAENRIIYTSLIRFLKNIK